MIYAYVARDITNFIDELIGMPGEVVIFEGPSGSVAWQLVTLVLLGTLLILVLYVLLLHTKDFRVFFIAVSAILLIQAIYGDGSKAAFTAIVSLYIAYQNKARLQQ